MSDRIQILLNASIKTTPAQLQSQLDKISKSLVLNIGKIKIDTSQIGKQIGDSAGAAGNAAGKKFSQGWKSSIKIFDPLQSSAVQTKMQGSLQGLTNTFERLQRSSNFSKVFSPQQVSAFNQQLSTMQSRIGGITNNRMAQRWNTDFTNMNNTVRGLNNQITAMGRPVQSLGEQLGLAAKKMIEWTLVGGAIFGVMHFIKEGIKTVIDLNSALTVINMTMDMSAEEMTMLVSESQKMAKQMGISISETLNAVKIYANANENIASILEKTKADIMLATASGMSY
jgi:hypothetical protein